jgi:hypothetical protein
MESAGMIEFTESRKDGQFQSKKENPPARSQDRYQSMAELIAVLERCKQGRRWPLIAAAVVVAAWWLSVWL